MDRHPSVLYAPDFLHVEDLEQLAAASKPLFFQRDIPYLVHPDFPGVVGDVFNFSRQFQHPAGAVEISLFFDDICLVEIEKLGVFHHIFVGEVRSHNRLPQHVARDLDRPIRRRDVCPQLVSQFQHLGARFPGGRQVFGV